tara:strand:- start:396 stop:785 length:390 start_codon:yes stop_codon:yes gene_type:complete
MARKNLRKTLKRRKSVRRFKGGNSCKSDACEDVKKEGYFSGGNRRRRKSRKNSRCSRRRTSNKKNKRKTGRRIKGGAFHGYSMWENAGPLQSEGVGLTKSILTARRHVGANPMDQPIEFKYGFHNTPKV